MIEIVSLASAVERIARKSAHMAEIDPHGLTLTLVCVCVVFGALLLLFGAYSLSGGFFTGKIKNPFKLLHCGKKTEVEEIAAISIALDDFLSSGGNSEEAVAIATALHLYLEDGATHDYESGIITIKRNNR